MLKLIATFLSNRSMTVRVGNDFSEGLTVNGGCPQGSVLRVYLFNVCSDNLEDHGVSGGVLDDRVNEVEIGSFFDDADREYLRNGQQLETSFEEVRDVSDKEEPLEELHSSFNVMSTPVPGSRVQIEEDISPFKLSQEEEQSFVFFGNTRNKRRPKCIVYTSDSSEISKYITITITIQRLRKRAAEPIPCSLLARTVHFVFNLSLQKSILSLAIAIAVQSGPSPIES